MTTHDGFGADEDGSMHEAVGAYVLGVLDDADATAFEEHVAGCEVCAARLEEFSGIEPMLALLADGPGRFAEPVPDLPAARERAAEPERRAPVRRGGLVALPGGAGADGPDVTDRFPGTEPAVAVRPSDGLLDRLVEEVTRTRARRRRRNFSLVAAAAVLIVGGPAVAVGTMADDGGRRTAQVADANTDSAYFRTIGTKYSATDPATRISATVGLETKAWGTSTVMELKNVKGPLKCRLIAVSKTGARQVVTSWSVPAWGYGIADSPHDVARKPLYVHGGAAIQPNEIDHFDVTTFDGKRLVEVPA